MAIKNATVNKIFDDLDAYRDFCRYEGKVFDEAALYNKRDVNWQAYEKYCEWKRIKARNSRKSTNTRRG